MIGVLGAIRRLELLEMDKVILEDLDELANYRERELGLYRLVTNSEKKSAHLENYIRTLPLLQRSLFFSGCSDAEIRLLASFCPLLLREECIRNTPVLKRSLAVLRRERPREAVFLLSVQDKVVVKDQAYKAAVASKSIYTFLYFCDVFSEPGSAPKAALSRHASQREILYAIQQNVDRANADVLEKFYLELKRKDKINISIISRFLIGFRMINSDHPLIVLLLSDYSKFSRGAETDVDLNDRKISEAWGDVTLDEVAQRLELSVDNLVDWSVSRKSPDLFSLVVKILSKKLMFSEIRNIAVKRLQNFPNALSASLALQSVFVKAQQHVLALGILERLSERYPYDRGIEYQIHSIRASLGDWDGLSRELMQYIKVRNLLRSDRPLCAITYMFTVDACPSLSFEDKYQVYKDISEGKNLRKRNVATVKKRKVSLIGGDFRNHAMLPILKGLALGIGAVADVQIISTCPAALEDTETQLFEKSYEFHRLEPSMKQADVVDMVNGSFISCDVSQYTEFNALKYFRRGLSPIQMSSYWASGFMTPEDCMDFMLVDQYSFRNVTVADGACYKLLHAWGAQVLPPTQILHWSRPEGTSFCLGIFVRPMRYSPQLFRCLRNLLVSGVVDRLVFSHSYLRAEKSQLFLTELLDRYEIPRHKYTISANALSDDILLANAAIDSFPVGSPTTTRDLLFAGMPVFVFDGMDVFGSLSSSFLQSLQVKELLWRSYEELQEAIKINRKKSSGKVFFTTVSFDVARRESLAGISEVFKEIFRSQGV